MVSFHHSTTIQYLSLLFATFFAWNTPECNGEDTTFKGNGQERFGSSYFFYQQPQYPRDCKEVSDQCETTNTSGVYMIKPDGYSKPFEVFCNNEIDSGGWTVIQRRVDGSVTFNRNWEEYKKGFGFLSSEFWIGNEKLSYLTNQADYILRVDMMLSNGSSFFIEYNIFRITDEWGVYAIVSVGTYSGNADTLITFCPPNAVFDGNNCLQPTTDPPIFTDCYDAYQAGHRQDGVYSILPSGWPGPAFDVPCNMSIDGGGWTVLQRRVNGSVNFERNWDGYKNGFGIPGHELWIGNDKMYYITNQRDYSLRMDMINLDGNAYFAKYNLFRITDEDSNYKLEDLGTYDSSSTTGYDAMRYHRDRFFSTPDRDNDGRRTVNCAAVRRSAWWYSSCDQCDFNRPQLGSTDSRLSPYWDNFPGSNFLLYADIKIRPV